MKRIVALIVVVVSFVNAFAQGKITQQTVYATKNDVAYSSKTDEYSKERLKLDIYYPEGMKDCPVVVWFHGGGLTAGKKEVPHALRNKGWTVVGVNYRLLPNVTIDQCLDDCAEAVAYVFKHVNEYAGSGKKIFVSGHSAGGYISMMLALNKAWLNRYGVDADSVAAYLPFSGQAISHFSYRKMNGLTEHQPTIDEYAPLFWVRKDCPPMILTTGDRELELYGRYEENALLARYMKLVGNTTTELYEFDGHDHGTMASPAFHILEKTINKVLAK